VIYLFLSSIDKNLKEKKKVSKEKRKKKGTEGCGGRVRTEG
jgi:hypothetical protein